MFIICWVHSHAELVYVEEWKKIYIYLKINDILLSIVLKRERKWDIENNKSLYTWVYWASKGKVYMTRLLSYYQLTFFTLSKHNNFENWTNPAGPLSGVTLPCIPCLTLIALVYMAKYSSDGKMSIMPPNKCIKGPLLQCVCISCNMTESKGVNYINMYVCDTFLRNIRICKKMIYFLAVFKK